MGPAVRRPFVRPFWFPLTLLLVGSAATIFVTRELRQAFDEQDAERFASAANQLEDRINDRIETYIAMLRAGAGLVSGSEVITRPEFRAFTDSLELERRYPGIQGIGFSARILPPELAAVTAAMRRAGHADFQVWPDGGRAEYHAILYLQPLDRRNLAAIGYDMFTDPTRRAAMERARDTGEPAASGVVTLVQEIDSQKQPGFLIYMPVYAGGPAIAAGERQDRLRGFVYSPFRAGDLFAGILGRGPRPRAGFELFDGEPSGTTLLHVAGDPDRESRFSTTRTIAVAGRQWTARIFSLPALEEGSNIGLVPFVGWGGAIITVLLTALAWNQARARARAEESEAVAAGASRSLQAQTSTLEVINRTGAQLAGELDLERLLQAVADAGTRLTGARFGAFFQKTVKGGEESHTLRTLSGIPREALGELPPPRDAEVFGPEFGGGAIVRSDDITLDPRFGGEGPDGGARLPGFPPVRSYLAVPVRSRSGQVLGTLLFVHPDPAVFTGQSEQIVAGIAAQAAVAIDNAGLYGEVQRLLASERAARKDAERDSRLKDEFLATLSHELRTPLNAVIGWAHMLAAGRLSEEKQRRAADAVLRNARAQSHLVEDLLDMSRIISGRLRMDLERVNLRGVLEAAADVVRPTADAKRIDLAVHVEDGAHEVRGDAARLQQVAWNLLSNAIKFTPPGGRVDVALRGRDDRVEFSVSDTGIGIDPGFMPFVFERFRQADGSFTRSHGGLGLGLSIVRNLVEMHAGDVRGSSHGAGRGTTFTVSFPRAPDAPRQPPDTERRRPGGTIRPETNTLRGLRALVVDDDDDGREVTREILEQHGAEVRTASSSAQALALLQSGGRPVDLLISDVGMPHMDGYELIRRLRALPVDAGLPARAIALTAYAGADDRRRALAAGFDEHLAKPYTPDDLLRACIGAGAVRRG